MNKWKTEKTRCAATTGSGKRCKLEIEAGEYVCKHHQQDLAHYVKNPNYVVGLIKSRYPKRHHPACDRKGQNDCSCHEFSNGALSMMALRQAVEKSQELSPLYRRKRRLEYRLKVKKIRAYYDAINEAELWLPKDTGFRQFRFFIWDDKKERIVVRVIKDNIKNKATLVRWLRRLAPLHVYTTTAAWLNPQGIGPDPKGKHGKSKMKKKGWYLTRYHDTMLYQGLYFDVDYDNADYNEGVNMLMKLRAALDRFVYAKSTSRLYAIDNQNGLHEGAAFMQALDDEPICVFSGGKGFHLVYQGFDSTKITNELYARYLQSGENQKFHRIAKGFICDQLKLTDPDLLLDWEVTVDPRRIIRLPGTIHGKTLRVCKVVDPSDIILDDTTGRYIYNADNPIG